MRLRAVIVPLIALPVVPTACGGDQVDTSDGRGTTQDQADAAMGGLCDLAEGGLTQIDAIDEAFFGRAHDALHLVAAQAQIVDPVVAGTLLEAKAAVEGDLDHDPPPPDLPAHAETLVEAFAGALEAIGLRARTCEGS